MLGLHPFLRSTIGFEPFFDMLGDLARWRTSAAYWPPHNLEKLGDNSYRLTLAVPGFGERDLNVEASARELIVRGRKSWTDGSRPLHRGLALADFDLRFPLAAYARVGDARLANGLLTVQIERRLPDGLKARRIPLGGGSPKMRLVKGGEKGRLIARAKRLLTGGKEAA